jgi:hypothetical protein
MKQLLSLGLDWLSCIVSPLTLKVQFAPAGR